MRADEFGCAMAGRHVTHASWAPQSRQQQRPAKVHADHDNEANAAVKREQFPNLPFCEVGACPAVVAKYKCPQCYIRYCSMSCYRNHRETPHEDGADSKAAGSSNHDPRSSLGAPPPLSEYIASTDPTNPTGFITNAPQLQWLFSKYPLLWDQLMAIRQARQPPKGWKPPIPGLSLRRRDDWTYEIGLERGLKALREAQEMTGEEGDGIREYVELVKCLIWSARDTEGAHLIRTKTEQDLQAVQHLIKKETRI